MIEITPFSLQHQTGVIELILPIQQREFGIDITLAEQPDLLEVPVFYQNGGGNFWVALDDGVVIGCIALLDIGNNQAALRKMFVAAPWRGKQYGIADALLAELLAWSRRNRIRQIYLGTTAQFTAAQRFYRKNGFIEIAKADLPACFPLMLVDSVFFCRGLDFSEIAE